ncbi:MAG TPA: alpha/beta fold hydrolase [Bacteroidia bacterium]|nr:alpha/beta fold hydrolase [Bacteroidia bacterium]
MKLAFREFGQGPALIILHGLFGQSDNWNTHAKNFADRGFNVFTIDLRNHGLSPHSDIWNYDVMADDLKEFIDDHHLTKPIILGHSMGAKTAMFFELKYEGIASKLIIADMSPGTATRHHDGVLKALNAVDFSKIENRKEAEAVLNEYIPDFGTKQFLLKNIYWKEEGNKQMSWRFNLEVISRKYDCILEAVPHGTSPVDTLVLRGEKSNYVTEKDFADFEKRFPNHTIQTIAGAGHWVHAEKPKEFFDAVISFLEKK